MTTERLFALRVLPPLPVRQLAGAIAIALVIFVWWFTTRGAIPEERIISPSAFPSPMEVIRGFPSLVTERNLIGGIAASLSRVFL